MHSTLGSNNLAERDLRPNKIQQNISGRLTSEKATFNRLAIRSYVSTAVKHQRKSRLSSRMQRVSLIRSFRCSRWCGYVVGGCGSATGQTEAASRRRQPFGEDAPSAWWRGLRCTSRVST